jgi:GAF domain
VAASRAAREDTPRYEGHESDVSSSRRGDWQVICAKAIRRLVIGEVARPLEVVLRFAVEAARADFAVLARSVGDQKQGDEMVVDEAVGAWAPGVAGHQLVSATVLGPVLRSGTPVLEADDARDESPVGKGRSPVGSLIAAPLLDDDRDDGGRGVAAVVVARGPGRSPFDETDLRHLESYAGHTAAALRLMRAGAERDPLVPLCEADTIASDVSDEVVKELFATGMGLLGVAEQIRHPVLRDRVLGFVDVLDDTIAQVRSNVPPRRRSAVEDSPTPQPPAHTQSYRCARPRAPVSRWVTP